MEIKLKPIKPAVNKPTAPISKSKQAKLLAQQQLEAEQLRIQNTELCRSILTDLINTTIVKYQYEYNLQHEIITCTNNAVQYIVDAIDYNTRQRYDIGEINPDLWCCEAPPKRCPIDNWAKNYIRQIPTITG